jgi:hypothetical protein
MTTISILPIATDEGATMYVAVAPGRRQSVGRSAGEALDLITSQFGGDELSTLVVIQHYRPDRFFSASQQRRLEELMRQWRTARDAGTTLTANARIELEALVQAEVQAAADRAAALADELGA